MTRTVNTDRPHRGPAVPVPFRFTAPWSSAIVACLLGAGCPADAPAGETSEPDTSAATSDGATADECSSSADCAGACIVVQCPAADGAECGHRQCVAECIDAFTQNPAEQACVDDDGCCGGETCAGGSCSHGHPGEGDGPGPGDGTTGDGTTGTTGDGTASGATTSDGGTTSADEGSSDGPTSSRTDGAASSGDTGSSGTAA